MAKQLSSMNLVSFMLEIASFGAHPENYSAAEANDLRNEYVKRFGKISRTVNGYFQRHAQPF